MPKLALYWLLAATPLGWGVYKSVKKALPLFSQSPPAAAAAAK